MDIALGPHEALNWVNLMTPVGLAVARVSGCPVTRVDGLWVGTGYRARFPIAGAFTIGGVVIARRSPGPTLLQHESGHVRQYAWLGLGFLPAYAVAASVSYALTGDWWTGNPFERHAGLAIGGYRPGALRPIWSRIGGHLASARAGARPEARRAEPQAAR